MTEKLEAKDVPIKQDELTEVYAWVNEFQQQYFNSKYPHGLETLADFVVPTDYAEQVKKAKELRDIGLVDRLLRIKQNYTLPIKGFIFKGKNTKRQLSFYNDNVLPLIQSFARQWIYEYNSVSEVFANYGFKNDGKIPGYLRVENTTQIDPISIFGNEVYEVKISPQLKKQVQRLKNIIDAPQYKLEEKEYAQQIITALPEYLKKAIDGKGFVSDKIILNQQNMFRSCDQKPDYRLRPKPGLIRIMKQLILRDFLIDLDFVNAFGSQKTNLTHVKAGTKEKPWTNKDKIQDLHKLITEGPPGEKIVTTPGDVDIIKIDNKLSDLFDPKKFERCNKDILDFFGISIVFIPTELSNINNQVVLVSLKPFEQEIKEQRKEFNRFLQAYFKQINEKNGFSEIPEIEYELTNIRDSKELINELGFLFEKGVISFYDIVPIFGYDVDEQIEKKQKAWKNRKDVSCYYENSQGLLNPLVPPEVYVLQYLGFSEDDIKTIIQKKYEPKPTSGNSENTSKTD